MTKHIQEILYGKSHSIDTIVLAEGSLNNVLLQANIQQLISVDFSTFEVDDWNYVISFGASLIGEGEVKVIERSKFNYGIKIISNGQMIPYLILPKGTEYGNRKDSRAFRPLFKQNSQTEVLQWSDNGNDHKSVGGFVLEDSDKPQVKLAMRIEQKTGILVLECIYAGKIVKQQEYHGR
ncbi:MAG: hypothetical protein KDK90_04355 [Leptospiraceae bacterium]|nr:hypothetical protein [Leptospiraceae bacterium]